MFTYYSLQRLKSFKNFEKHLMSFIWLSHYRECGSQITRDLLSMEPRRPVRRDKVQKTLKMDLCFTHQKGICWMIE